MFNSDSCVLKADCFQYLLHLNIYLDYNRMLKSPAAEDCSGLTPPMVTSLLAWPTYSIYCYRQCPCTKVKMSKVLSPLREGPASCVLGVNAHEECVQGWSQEFFRRTGQGARSKYSLDSYSFL